MSNVSNTNVSKKTKVLVKTAILGVIAFIVMFLEFPLPPFAAFLKMDLSDIPAVVGAFALGPFAGIAIELLKNVLHFMTGLNPTGGVGELANFIVGSSLIIPAALIYKRNKSKKSALIGLLVGIVVMVIMGAIVNYYILLPLYAKGMPSADAIKLIIYGISPFNLVKGFIITIISALLYKRISPILHR